MVNLNLIQFFLDVYKIQLTFNKQFKAELMTVCMNDNGKGF